MHSAFADSLGIDPTVFHYVILPLFIFIARICDVSINTLRVIFMLNGRRLLSTFMGFFEALIWLLAIGQILQNVNSPISYLAYAGGFAAGIFVGMLIEHRLAIGNVMVRIITTVDGHDLMAKLQEQGYRLTAVDAQGAKGPVNVIFMILNRKKLSSLVATINRTNPNAFYTVEGVKYVNDTERIAEVSPTGWRNFLKRSKA